MQNLRQIRVFVLAIPLMLILNNAGFSAIEGPQAWPALQVFPAIKSDNFGRQLQSAMIWTNPPLDQSGVTVGFRKTVSFPQRPARALLRLFADVRYVLWVNGAYVERGPSRFQPNGPQYDTIDLTPFLRAGSNTLAVLVVGELSGGKVMRHTPCLTALLEADGHETLRTDSSWKWNDNTRFRGATATWANLSESLIDATAEDGDWTQANYNDTHWKTAVGISGDVWGPLTPKLIPPLRETPVPVALMDGATLPIALSAGQKLTYDSTRIVQAYPVIELEAEAGTQLMIEPIGLTYVARAGRQTFFPLDTQGFSQGSVTVKSGHATISGLKLIERTYPYEVLGSFESNDDYLNRLWAMSARSCEVLSEDSYVDCADRERVEWMDDDPPGFNITRTAMAGPGPDGQLIYSDPRLLGSLIRRIALTLQPDGWVKAHTASDRFDIHAKMEDRACEWVAGVRRYYEATGDTSILHEIWPAITAQMDYFLERRTANGLVRGRDWVVWGNPLGYFEGETTTLNAFVQRALVDAAYLARIEGDTTAGAKYTKAAEDLAKAMNLVLWDEKAGAYYSGYFDDSDSATNRANRRQLPASLPLTDHLTPTTLEANLFALDRGIVPSERRAKVIAKMLEQQGQLSRSTMMIYYYVIGQLYALDRPELDERVLSLFREKWQAMVFAPWQCSWEDFKIGSKAHIYGMFPGYFLSSYVLGVRWEDGVPINKKLLIEPHLADLTTVEGKVVTESGVVPVSWKRDTTGNLAFTFTVPIGVKATLRVPAGPTGKFTLNSKPATGKLVGQRYEFALAPGSYSGTAN
jgi:alpha-L-rhamnosidase